MVKKLKMSFRAEHISKNVDVICILELIGIKYYKQRFRMRMASNSMRAFLMSM